MNGIPGRPPTTEDLARLARTGVVPGLCASCAFARVLASRSSLFLRCGLAATDPRFPRYPPLPVRACGGYREREGDAPDGG